MRKILLLILILTVCLVACQNNGNTSTADISADSLMCQTDSALADTINVSDTITIRYAKGLQVDYTPEGIRVSISNPDPAAKNKEATVITVTKPLTRFICTTALQLGNFEALGLEDCIVGVNSFRNLFSPRINAKMRDGSIVRIGKEGNFDLEAVIAAQPDYIFVSTSKHGGFDVLRGCDIPLLPHHGYKETHPLGQAEWIKLIGILTGQPRRANAVFNDIELKYLKLKAEAAALPADQRPTVISGRQMRDGWYVMGGKSYMAQLFADAGADYILKDLDETGGTTLDFETVYAKAMTVEFWQTDGPSETEYTLADLADEDSRYADLPAFTNGNVLFCNLSKTPYRELSPMEPHRVLADFIKAFHPELLPHYTPKYYKLIK